MFSEKPRKACVDKVVECFYTVFHSQVDFLQHCTKVSFILSAEVLQ